MAKISNTIKVKKDDGGFEDIQISYIQPNYCTAEGYQTTASGYAAHAEGSETTAFGANAHAEGNNTIAFGEASHAEGVGENPISNSITNESTNEEIINIYNEEGAFLMANGKGSHAEGVNTLALRDASHAEGADTIASGIVSHAEGCLTTASGKYSHAEGYETTASGNYSHTEGKGTAASEDYSHAEGRGTTASGKDSHAEGAETTASKNQSHAEGYGTEASGSQSHAEGVDTIASGEYSHAEGNSTVASGVSSHTEGDCTTAYGFGSHAEGTSTNQASVIIDPESIDDYAIVDAWNTNKFTLAFGPGSHAEGDDTLALGLYSHAEGGETIAYGMRSHAEGEDTVASGNSSHASGRGTTARADYQFVIGKYNLPWQIKGEDDPYVFMIGNGDYVGTKVNRSNAMTVDWSGKGSFASTVGTNGADYAEYFEWEDKNLLNEDRVGYLVSLNKNKIQKAQYNDNILGIISGTAGMLGDNYEWEWKNKYLTDNFGRILYEEKEQFIDIPIFDEEGNKTIERKSLGIKKVPKLNPEYNPNENYVSRADRPEWDIVGLMGKLYLRDDGTCIPGEYAKVGTEPGVATYSETETKIYVMERVNDNIIKVFFK